MKRLEKNLFRDNVKKWYETGQFLFWTPFYLALGSTRSRLLLRGLGTAKCIPQGGDIARWTDKKGKRGVVIKSSGERQGVPVFLDR